MGVTGQAGLSAEASAGLVPASCEGSADASWCDAARCPVLRHAWPAPAILCRAAAGAAAGGAPDAEAGLAEVMAMPAIWKDAGGRLLELAGPGSGIVACGALPGAAAPGPA